MLGELNYSLEVQRYLLLMFTDVCKYSIVWDVSVRLLVKSKKATEFRIGQEFGYYD